LGARTDDVPAQKNRQRKRFETMKKRLDLQIRELEERLEALIIAVPKEEAAYHFYLDLANTTTHEGTRKMFLKLADQELDHKRNLEMFVDEIHRELKKLRAEKAKL
jgi:rubrerythrin